MTADVTIAIPVWNRVDLLRKLLDTISQQTLKPTAVIVVDDCSTEAVAETARKWGARVIVNAHRIGFAASVNRAVEQANSRWVALVNSDVELHPEWLYHLRAGAESSSAWFAAGPVRMASDRERLDGAWDLVARSGCGWRAGHGALAEASYSRSRRITLASATATLYRRELFDRIGGFCELYESYLEDVDLSLRAAAHAYQGVYIPHAICWHWGSASTSQWSGYSTRQIARNQALLVRRLYPAELQREWHWEIIAGQYLWGLLAFRKGQFRAWLSGHRAGRREEMVATSHLPMTELRQIITDSEHELRELTRDSPGWYWRLYFMFTRGGSE